MSASHILSQASLQSLGCKLWLPLNGDTKDYSGNGYNGTASGMTYDKVSTGEYAGDFDGADDYVNLGDILDALFTSNVFTICAWVKLRSYQDHNGYDGFVIQKWYTTSSTANAFILQPWAFTTQGAGVGIDKTNVPLDEWVFVTAVIDNGDMYLYHNCILVASGTGGYCNNCDYDMRIGSLHNNHYDFDGDISNVMIFDQALSITNINRLYAATRILPDRTGVTLNIPEPVLFNYTDNFTTSQWDHTSRYIYTDTTNQRLYYNAGRGESNEYCYKLLDIPENWELSFRMYVSSIEYCCTQIWIAAVAGTPTAAVGNYANDFLGVYEYGGSTSQFGAGRPVFTIFKVVDGIASSAGWGFGGYISTWYRITLTKNGDTAHMVIKSDDEVTTHQDQTFDCSGLPTLTSLVISPGGTMTDTKRQLTYITDLELKEI
jgi:hypothetical protein